MWNAFNQSTRKAYREIQLMDLYCIAQRALHFTLPIFIKIACPVRGPMLEIAEHQQSCIQIYTAGPCGPCGERDVLKRIHKRALSRSEHGCVALQKNNTSYARAQGVWQAYKKGLTPALSRQ